MTGSSAILWAANREELPGDVTLVDECYNAQPMSMPAASEELPQNAPPRQAVAVRAGLKPGASALVSV